MARRSRFTEDERRDAVVRAFGSGSSPGDVASELGVSVPTIYRWAQAPKPAEPAGDDAVARRLTEAAQELLRDDAYPDITVEAVARRAGVPLRTAFARYPSKRALFGAAVDRAAEAIVEDMASRAAALDWPSDAVGRLELFLVVNSNATYDHPGSHVLFRDLGVPLEDRFAERWHDAFREALTALLREVDAAGGLRRGVDVESAGRALARGIRGMHVSTFEGVPRDLVLGMVARLPLLALTAPDCTRPARSLVPPGRLRALRRAGGHPFDVERRIELAGGDDEGGQERHQDVREGVDLERLAAAEPLDGGLVDGADAGAHHHGGGIRRRVEPQALAERLDDPPPPALEHLPGLGVGAAAAQHEPEREALVLGQVPQVLA
jgi:AcrR family transcriptional regulator